MFFSYFLGKNISVDESIKQNLINLFDQRCKLSLLDYDKYIDDSEVSKYRYYGIIDLFYLNEDTTESFVNHVKKSILIFDSRIKEVDIFINIDGVIVNFELSYLTYFNKRSELLIKLRKN